MTANDLLLALPASASVILSDAHFQTLASCARILDLAEESLFTEPGDAVEIAWVGVRLAAGLRTSDPSEACELMLAEALLCYGGACRVVDRFSTAEAAYLCASDVLASVEPPLEILTNFCGRLALLRRDQRRFVEAREAGLAAVQAARATGSQELVGWSLVRLAAVLACEGAEELQAAIPHCLEALKFLSKERNKAEFRSAVQILVTAHLSGEANPEEVRRWLRIAKDLDRGAPEGSPMALKLLWLEGLAHGLLGNLNAAVKTLRIARDGLLKVGMQYHAALVSLDLTLLYLKRNEHEAATALAGEMFPVFKSLNVDREAIAVLKLFVNAASAGQLTVDLVEDVKRRIETCFATQH